MSRTIHALIVGINAYATRPLYGCVNDALAFGKFFRDYCASVDRQLTWNPSYLLAPQPADLRALQQAETEEPALKNRQLPLRDNLIAAFDRVFNENVKPGDICLVYYSGHGSLEPIQPGFEQLEPEGFHETFVCLDSRQPGGRDLTDKEFAWLLHRVKQRIPEGHLLVVTDSCHSGGATRSSDVDTRERRESATDAPSAFETWLGVQNVPEADQIIGWNGKQAYYKTEARHIHLAASRDRETAKETTIQGVQHGVFTWNLLRTLGTGGSALSYREIMRRVETMVRNSVTNQIPQLNAFAGADKNESFLGGALAAARIEYPVSYKNWQWRLEAGAFNGILLDPRGERPTLVRLSDGREVQVREVYSGYSVLDGAGFGSGEAVSDLSSLRATVEQMPNSGISVYIDRKNMSDDALTALEKALEKVRPHYAAFNAVTSESADYSVQTDEEGRYMLVLKGSTYPVFKRQSGAFDFVSFCDNVGRWRFAQEMGKPAMAGLSPDDVAIDLEILTDVNPASINTASGRKVSADQVNIRFSPEKKERQGLVPALRCSVRLKKTGYWIGGLYLDTEFGIYSFLDAREDSNGAEHVFQFKQENITYNAIPLVIDPVRLKQGFRTTTEYLKIYVSNQPFTLTDFEQQPLPLDDRPVTKGPGFGAGGAMTPDWMVITIPVTIQAVSAQTDLKSLSGTGFSISEIPEGFSARAAVASVSEIRAKLENSQTERGTELALTPFVLPPAGLWGESMEESMTFTKTIDGQQDAAVSVMELTDVSGALNAPFFLDLDQPCAEDEVLVAYGYDESADAWFPMGISQGNERLEILALPSETPGLIQAEEEGFTGRGLGRSVKMFFKKLVRKQNPNALKLIKKDLSEVTDPVRIKEAVANARQILTICHGYLGDNDKILEAVFKRTGIHHSYDVVLAYEWECLNTPLQETAGDLYNRLNGYGVFDPEKGHRLTLLGSSTAGVVCRWLVEHDARSAGFVRQLFLTSSPNLGTDMSTFRKRLFGLIGKALSGVAVLKPYLTPLSILAKKADKEFWYTLEQLNPSSDFIMKLNQNTRLPDGVVVHALGGTVKGMGLKRNNRGNFFKRLKKFVLKTFMDWFVFEGEHDLVNPLKSQNGAPWFKTGDIVVLPLDHLSYYFEPESLAVLEKALTVEEMA